MSRSVDALAALGGAAVMGAGVLPFLHVDDAPDCWYRLVWPRNVEEDAVLAILRHLAATRRPNVVTFEAEAKKGVVTHRVGVTRQDRERLRDAFANFLPEVLLEELDRPTLPLAHGLSVNVGTRERSLRVGVGEEISRSIIGAMVSAPDTSLLQVQLGTRLAPLHVPKDTLGLPTTGRAVGQAFRYGLAPLDAKAHSALQSKVGDQGFRVQLCIGSTITDQRAAEGALRTILGGLRVAEAPGALLKVKKTNAASVAKAQPPRRYPLAVNVAELVGLLAWPLGDGTHRGVTRAESRRLPVTAAIPSEGRAIGVGTHPSTRRPVAQALDDTMISTWLLGPTGTGKSTLLANMILSDIEAGRGCLVIDPKTDLIDDLLQRLPAERLDDIIVLDPSDPAPAGLNPLHHRSPDLAADSVVSILASIFPEGLGPRSTDLIYASVHALASTEGGSLAAIPTLLTNEAYRRQVTRKVKDPIAQSVWAWFEQLSTQERASVVAPPLNKLRPILRPALRAVLAQPEPKLRIDDIFDRNRIVLVKLDYRTLGAAGVALLGSIVVSEAWRAAQRRSRVAAAERKPVSIYLDEWQALTHGLTDLADVLARTRGYGVGWVLANQNGAQLSPALRAAVMANARSKVLFRLSAEDAALLARTTDLLDSTDFQSLGRFEAYASLVADGTGQPFCSLVTRPLPAAAQAADDVVERSRARWGVDREQTERYLQDLVGQTSSSRSGSMGSRRRRRTEGDAS